MQAVDVLIPVRWPAPWLAETLEFVGQQTLKPHAVIVAIHGNEGDVSGLVDLAPLASMNIVRVPIEATLSDVRNAAFSASTSVLIAPLDSDDLWHPDHLAALSRHFHDNEKLTLVGGGADYMDESGSPLGQGGRVSPRRPDLQLLIRNPFVQSAVMFRRSAALDVDGYQDCKAAEDLLLWLSLAGSGGILRIDPTVRVNYRLHAPTQTSGSAMDSQDVDGIWQARRALARRRHIPERIARVGPDRSVRTHIRQNFTPVSDYPADTRRPE